MHDVAGITGAIASGDPEAFARLYEARFDMLYHLIRKRTRLDEHDTLDVVHDAMLRVIRHMKPLQTVEALDAWLTRVAMSAAWDHFRRQRRRRAREIRAIEDSAQRARDAARRAGDDQERLDWLRAELRRLDAASAELLDLRFRAGLTLAAIADQLGLKTGAVDGRVTRTLRAMERSAKEGDDA